MAQVNVDNVQIKPIKAIFGEDKAQVQKITCVADVASSLQNKYFHIYDTAGVKYHVWFNVGGAGVDPAPAGSTAAVVAIAANDSASVVATAVKNVIDALALFTATVSGAAVTMTNTAVGYVPENHDAQGAGGKCLFSFLTLTVGDEETDLGLLEGDVEVAGFKPELKDIKAHQYGDTILSKVKTSAGSQTVKLNIYESTLANFKKILVSYGASLVPVGAGASEVVGLGTAKQFQVQKGRKLRLHPVAKGDADLSEDLTFWFALPSFTSVKFSGTEFLTYPVEFEIFPDLTKHERINMFCFGDSSQSMIE
jgi:hypothetical protein